MATQVTSVPAGTVRRSLRRTGPHWPSLIFLGLLAFSLLITLLALLFLLLDILNRGLPVLLERGVDFLTSPLSSDPAKAGVSQALWGTSWIGTIVVVVAFPLGVATAVYLEEYAPASRLTRLIDINIRNLAGIPSIVYGLLGLAVFVGIFKALGIGNGRNVIAGGLTVAALVLPIVIITSAEALRAVPLNIREAGYGVGASRWQVTWGLVLPAAFPGVLTGIVLSLSRALGETAPLILAGAVLGSFSSGNADLVRHPPGSLHGATHGGLSLDHAAARSEFRQLAARGHDRAARHHLRRQRRRPSTFGTATQGAGDGRRRPRCARTRRRRRRPEPVIRLEDVSLFYGAFRAVRDVPTHSRRTRITAIIGPSGCGKSTLLRSINRMNDLVPASALEGRIAVPWRGPVRPRRRSRRGPPAHRDGVPEGQPVPQVDLRQRRLRAAGQRLSRATSMTSWSRSLRRAALWDDVKDKLKQSGMALSGGQQQRLCIARAIATEPEVILMDEPCSALDPRSTLQIEELMAELKERYTIVIVTHNMQQAARASDETVFLTMGDDRAGYLVEAGVTTDMFTNPKSS